uniref:NS3 n=1 Tax=uncultured densovirus TaxID=748192 RepID=A0A7L7YQG5_9VIRU|nr:NS3 [uncultured densovirus]
MVITRVLLYILYIINSCCLAGNWFGGYLERGYIRGVCCENIHSRSSTCRDNWVRMDNCVECGLSANGSQLHKHCWDSFFANNEEVAQLMAGAEEELPSEELPILQRTTPLSMDVVDEQMEYYGEMAEDHEEENRRETYSIEDFPKSLLFFNNKRGVVGNKISINRYVTGAVRLESYRLMIQKWNIIIRVPKVSMVIECRWNLQVGEVYHVGCVPESSRDVVTKACIKIVEFERQDFSEYMRDNLEYFFCGDCSYSICDNYVDWEPYVTGRAYAALKQKHVMIEARMGSDIKFALEVSENALLSTDE